jgi:PAS domain S-box-containing protein
MTKQTKFFYLFLLFTVLITCYLLYIFASASILEIVALLLTGINIALVFYLLRYKNKFDKFRLASENALVKMKMDLEETYANKSELLEMKYQQIKQSEGQFREAFEAAMQGMALLSLDGTFLKVNTAICDIIGYQTADLLRADLQSITPPDDYRKDKFFMAKLIKGDLPSFQLEKRLYHSEGLTAWVLQNMLLVRDFDNNPLHFVVQFVDITERKQTVEQLKKYTETLTVLLREVNHRVKNNLSALISMLHMEQIRAGNNQSNNYIDFLNDLISRIESLSTVHSMLSAQNWQPLELSELCNRVIGAATTGIRNKEVQIRITPANIKVNSNQAHHLTLVLNELTTNSIKHAFRDKDSAAIDVDITHENGYIQIRFKDDGPGFPQALIDGDFRNANIGFELIRGIVVQSLDGSFKLENNNGANAILMFQNELDEIS